MDFKKVQILSGMTRRPIARTKLGLFLALISRALLALAAFSALPASSDTGLLNDTGITACANSTSSSVDCASSGGLFPRQDGSIGRDAQYAGLTIKPLGGGGNAGFDFIKIANDGTVLGSAAAPGSGPKDWACTRDNVTGLMWEVKTSSGLRNQSHTYKWYQDGQGVASTVSDTTTCEAPGRCDTKKFVDDVNAAGLCGSVPGSNNWRMPTVKELENIVDFSQISPSIDLTYFPYTNAGTENHLYWSATVSSSYPNAQYAWLVGFQNGIAVQAQPYVPRSVRLVRGVASTATYTLGQDISGNTVSSIVTDSRTGLMWKRTHELNAPIQADDWRTLVQTFNWQQALERAKSDKTGGYEDWRLPNIKELRSLMDESQHDPAIDSMFSTFTPPPFQAWFWSSSIYRDYSGNQNYSLVVSSDQGSNQYSPRFFIQHVRLVRGGNAFDKFGGIASLSTNALNFGTQGLYSTSSARTITLTNSGSGVLTVSGIAASPNDYASTSNCGATLAAGASCSINVTFTPSAAGIRNGSITISGSPQTVSLQGSGIQSAVSLSPGGIDFGVQTLNTSATQTVTLSNTAVAQMDITSIFASGADYTQTNICRALTTGASCAISVTFTPTAFGIRTGVITITSNAAGSPHSLNLTGSGAPAVQYALTINKTGTGAGVVSSTSGIDCGALCSALYSSGTVVILSASPDSNSTFAGWSGAGCSGTNTCTVTVNQAQYVTATFTSTGVGSYTLTVAKTGTGTGTVSSTTGINCGALCSVLYNGGNSVTLTASPDSNSTFDGWSGAGCSGTGPCTVIVNQAQYVTATFTSTGSGGGSYTLTVNKSGTGTGTVASSQTGINCGALCSAVYSNGTSVTLTATAATGSTFAGWSGAGCFGVGTCTVTVNQAQSITATFTAISTVSYTLTVTKTGTGTGTVASSQTGINCGALCSAVYTSGTSVTLTATAATGSTFASWGGNCSGTTTTCTVTVSQARSVTATFTASPNTITVIKAGSGLGTVSSPAGSGLYCGTGSGCSLSVPSGTIVTLTATATTGSTFAGWGGDCSGTTTTCTVSMSQARNVSATFTLSPNTITVSKTGTGLGTVSSPAGPGLYCGTVCSVTYPSGTSVTLTATATTGSAFAGWGGDCLGMGTATTCTVSMSQARSVTATFTLSPNTITVSKTGTGLGTVSSPAGSGLYCGTVCSVTYPSGTSVTLTATATTGNTFAGWGGDCSGTATTCTVSMNQARSVTATFTASPNTITVSKAGTGLGTVSSPAGSGLYCGTVCSVSYPSGTSVTLTATATTGSTFAGWSEAGCSGLTCTVVMNKAQNVTATFAPSRYALVVARSGNGSGTVVSSPTGINCGAPCIAYFDSGTSVTLTATAVQGSTFAGWSGASCSGIGACTVAVNQTKDVTANFTGSLGGGVVPVPSLQPAGLYDGIYQWDTGYYLSVHQKGDGALIGSIYWTYTANTEQVGARTIPEADTFDLLQGQIVGSGATMSGTRFYRACTLSYDLTFNANSTLTVRLNSVSNSPGVSAADVNCAARYNTVGSTWTIPRIY